MKKAIVLILALLMTLTAAYAEEPTLDLLSSLEWDFSSGAGAWSTGLRIAPDGTYKAIYHDSEMGDATDEYPEGTVYLAVFTGHMSLGAQLDDHSWEVHIDSLNVSDAPGEEIIEDGVRYITAEPYGISEGDTMRLYLPGTPVEGFTEEMQMWAHLFDMEEAPAELPTWFLYSEKNNSGFVGTEQPEDVGMINPWIDTTAEQLTELSGLSFGVPEGAENVIYRWLEADQLAEMQFTLDGDEYCARIQPAAEVMNISGMYFAWDHEEAVQINHCEGTLGLAQTGSEDWVELCQWFDAAPGLMYSLSVSTTDSDGLDLTAVADMVYLPVQGEV